MTRSMSSAAVASLLGLLAWTAAALAADYPAPQEGAWIAKDFRFRTGETMAPATG